MQAKPIKKRELHNHHLNANQAWYDALNETPGRVGPAIEPSPEPLILNSDWTD